MITVEKAPRSNKYFVKLNGSTIATFQYEHDAKVHAEKVSKINGYSLSI